MPRIPGTWVKFAIVRKGDVAPSESHTIELYINQTGISFKDENSNSDVLYVDKIRYSNAGKVDIHMDQTDASDIGVRIVAVGPTENATNNVKLIPFQGVAPSPGGETILTEYTFALSANGGIIEAVAAGTLGNNTVLLPVPAGKRVIGAKAAFYPGGLSYDISGNTYYYAFTQVASSDDLTVHYYYY